MDDIVTVVRNAINEKGMTVKAVAQKAGIPIQALSASLCGRRRLLATDFISLCRVLDISPDDVVAQGKAS
jgi:transcriptional regulator with XRE-family HTH domain